MHHNEHHASSARMAQEGTRRMKVNGTSETLNGPLSVAGLVESRGLNPARVAVELNGNIVPRAERATTMLKDSDTVEIVSFVQGG